jgi:hypothetical protein
LGQALIRGDIDTFKAAMTESAHILGADYLEEMLQKSKLLQQHLL